MGGGPVKTGIGLIDNPINDTRSALENGYTLDQLGRDLTRNGQDFGNSIRDGVAGYARNLERGTQQAGADIGLLVKGNWNGALGSLTKGPLLISGANPDELGWATFNQETGSERLKRETMENQVNTDRIIEENRVAEIQRQTANTISGLVDAYNRSPGRRATLMGNYAAGNTLLTMVNK